MKKQSSSKSGFITHRIVLGALLGVAGISLAMVGFAATAASNKVTTKSVARPSVPAAPTPGNGTLTSANIGSANAINYMDSVGSAVPNLTFFAGSGTCSVPMSCSTFTLTIDSSVGTLDPTKYSIFIEVSWAQATEDYDTWMCSGAGNCTQANVVASNTSTADPETITLPTTTPAGVYTINLVNTSGAAEPYNGTVYLKPIPTTTGCTGNCTPPRYQNYPAGVGQADNAGEPSIGVDWNPNVASLKDTSSADFTTGVKVLNVGGVAFFTSGANEWRVNFDDCPSPAINLWEDVSATTTQQFVLSDPIGFVDHYSSSPLGLVYPPPHTPGRVFTLDLVGGQGNSLGSFSDNDGNSYTPGGNGGPGQGPDHETLGGGPYNPNSTPPPPPQTIAYGSPNAIYYCSQNIVAEAECSRSDNGGQTFGPGVIIYNPTVCTGSIHGHVKVAPDGTVYVPNSSCGENGGTTGAAVSTDNGITWNEGNVPGSSSTQDPSVGIGQNNVGKSPGNLNGTNTIYIGYADGDGHAKVAHSGDRGATWSTPVDVGLPFGVTHAVFPVVVAGDDNRAAFGFLGTGDGITVGSGTCDPYGATLNCGNIWHLYIATTYDGGANWVTIDATPNDPVQTGVVCLQGTTCAAGRNLLDFNDFSVDSEGRGLLGYADGCINCGNTFQGQSGASHGTVARQSGGRRLFSAFDPVEPNVPAAPQLISATTKPGGVLVSWLEPDNGGSPITGYNIYRSTTPAGGGSGAETFLAHVSGETTTQYFDSALPAGTTNAFYYATAINTINGVPSEGSHCGEVSISNTIQQGNTCTAPYVEVDGASTGQTDPTGELTIQNINVGEPFKTCTDHSITFTMKVTTMDPGTTGTATPPANSAWTIYAHIIDDAGNPETIWVGMDTIAAAASPASPEFSWGRQDPSTAGTNFTDTTVCTAGGVGGLETCPTISGSVAANGLITIKLTADTPLSFPAPTGATGNAFTWTPKKGDVLSMMTGQTLVEVGGSTPIGFGGGILFTFQTAGAAPPGNGTYTMQDNLSCQKLVPIAVLTASPQSGNAPLTVNFSGTSSHEQAGSCGAINSYTIDFGDGSAPVTNSTGTFSHTYTAAGDYPAKLTVSDTLGQKSTNTAQVTISVTSGVNLVSVVSRMQHGTITPPFEVNLPLTGTRGVECRSSSSLGAGNYTIVFQFDNALASVGGASVSTGTGSVSSRAIGLNNHEYIVNLTGVSDQQYVAVTLTGVQGAANGGTVVGPQMGVLVGDINASGRVDAADVSSARQQTLQPLTSSNFRDDLNASGRIDAADVSIARQDTLHSLPSTP